MHIVLYQPQIPPNTGNLIRLCANSGCQLHLIEPLGFSMHTKALRRAGLDYHEAATVQVHKDLTHCLELLAAATVPGRVYAATTKGSMPYSDINYQLNDVLLFGPETQGLPDEVLQDERVCKKIRIPMLPDSRSLNLSNAVAIVAYEALRQQGHPGLD